MAKTFKEYITESFSKHLVTELNLLETTVLVTQLLLRTYWASMVSKSIIVKKNHSRRTLRS